MTAPTIEQVREALGGAADSLLNVRDAGPEEELEALSLRALAASLEGMVLCPKEPTKAMRDAGGWTISDCRSTSPDTHTNDVATLTYRAMLAAEGEK